MAQIATTIEQSEKLVKLGMNIYTADMHYWFDATYNEWELFPYPTKNNVEKVHAWSLGALIELMPEYIDTYELFRIEIRHEEIVYLNASSLLHAIYGEDIFENCIRMIEFLVKNKFIKTDK